MSKLIGRAFVSDVSKFVNPLEVGESVIGSAVNVVEELNALARNEPLPKDTVLEDNKNEDLLEAQLRLEFAFGERLGNDLAYRDITQQQSIIPLLEEDNTLRHYQIIKIKSGHEGIVGNILIPYSNPERLRIYVNFRGTVPSALASLHLNLEHLAGEESFHRHFDSIMGQINTIIGEISDGKDVEIITSGHSLGGALSQYFLNATMLLMTSKLKSDLMKEGVDKETQTRITVEESKLKEYLSKQYKINNFGTLLGKYSHFAKVKTVRINTWGAAGISQAVERCSNRLADILTQNGFNIDGRIGVNTLDPVPKTGQGNALSLCHANVVYMCVSDKSLDVKASVLSGVIKGATSAALLGGGVWGVLVGGATVVMEGLRPVNLAHSANNFGSTGEKLPGKVYKIIFSNTQCLDESEKIHDKLLVLQNPVLLRGKSYLQQLGDIGTSCKQTVKGAIVKQLAYVQEMKTKKSSRPL
jgi:hypothetical protein